MLDQHAGMGGSYALDPKTGERALVERTAEPVEAPTGAFLMPVDPVTPVDTTTTTTE